MININNLIISYNNEIIFDNLFIFYKNRIKL